MKNAAVLGGLLLIGCASTPPSSCEMDTVPDGATITRIHGLDLAQYPSPLPAAFSGCQHTWIGDATHPREMEKLRTAYFENGKVQWFAATRPKGPEFRCIYRSGVLDESESEKTAECPLAADLERR